MGDPDAASTSRASDLHSSAGATGFVAASLLGAVRLKHCNKPKPPLHVELGLKKLPVKGHLRRYNGRGRDAAAKAGTRCDGVVVRRI